MLMTCGRGSGVDVVSETMLEVYEADDYTVIEMYAREACLNAENEGKTKRSVVGRSCT